MIRRPLWVATGVALGVGGTLWAERRVRQAMERLTPTRVARESSRQLAARVREAVAAGRDEAQRTQDELRGDLNGSPHRADPGSGSRRARR